MAGAGGAYKGKVTGDRQKVGARTNPTNYPARPSAATKTCSRRDAKAQRSENNDLSTLRPCVSARKRNPFELPDLRDTLFKNLRKKTRFEQVVVRIAQRGLRPRWVIRMIRC